MNNRNIIDTIDKKLRSLSIQPDGSNYRIIGKIDTYKNGELLEVNKVEIASQDSQEISDIINELVLILSADFAN